MIVVRDCSFHSETSFAAASGAKSLINPCGRIILRVTSDSGPWLVDDGQCEALQGSCTLSKHIFSGDALRKFAINASFITL